MITASEVGAVVGTNPYMKEDKLLRMKLGLEKFNGNAATAWGNTHEDAVRDWFCEKYGEKCHETGCVRHESIPFLGASPDGILESGAVLEIKCPMYRTPEEGLIPAYYVSQMQLQMEVCNLDKCYFVEWKPCREMFGEDVYMVQIVNRDRKWVDDNIDKLTKFWHRLQSYRNDPSKVAELRAKLESRPPRKKRRVTGTDIAFLE